MKKKLFKDVIRYEHGDCNRDIFVVINKSGIHVSLVDNTSSEVINNWEFKDTEFNLYGHLIIKLNKLTTFADANKIMKWVLKKQKVRV